VSKVFVLTASLVISLSITQAHAASSYVGKWAATPAQCNLAQSNPRAPLLLSERNYDQHEAHCVIGRVSKGLLRTTLTARCSVEGATRQTSFTARVSGGRLTINEKGTRPRTLVRC
jgi:hypothetical protein